MASYRPLAGCKLFPAVLVSVPGNQVTVPLRGVRVVSAIVYNISVEWSTVFVQL